MPSSTSSTNPNSYARSSERPGYRWPHESGFYHAGLSRIAAPPFSDCAPGANVMNDTPATTRDELRRRFLGQAAAAFDLMFARHLQEDLVTFDQRERRALELGQQL